MSATECAVCAWRGTCNVKFQYQSMELHCRDFSRDVTLDHPQATGPADAAPPEKKEDAKAE